MKTTIHPRIVLALIFTLLLGGCVYSSSSNKKNIGAPQQTLEQTPVCCQTYGELPFKILPPKLKAKLFLNAADPVIEPATGKSYVEPLRLPDDDGVTLLQIDSLVSPRHATQLPTVAFPVVTLLDSHYQPVATFDQLPFKYKSSLIGTRRIRVVITIDDRYNDVRYALIHTQEKALSWSLSTQNPVRIIRNSGFDSMLYSQNTRSRKRILFSNSGVFEVLAYPLEQG